MLVPWPLQELGVHRSKQSLGCPFSDPPLKVTNFWWVKWKTPPSTNTLRGWLGATKIKLNQPQRCIPMKGTLTSEIALPSASRPPFFAVLRQGRFRLSHPKNQTILLIPFWSRFEGPMCCLAPRFAQGAKSEAKKHILQTAVAVNIFCFRALARHCACFMFSGRTPGQSQARKEKLKGGGSNGFRTPFWLDKMGTTTFLRHTPMNQRSEGTVGGHRKKEA